MDTAKSFDQEKMAAMDLADSIFKLLKEEPLKSLDGTARFNETAKRYPNFAKAYPIILRYMARELQYNRHAFEDFLNYPTGRGMEAYFEHQAHYARLLYIHACKSKGIHVERKKSHDIFKTEYDAQIAYYNKIRREEKEAKNEFKEESEKYLVERKKELLDFLNDEAGMIEEPPKPEPSFNNLSQDEMRITCSGLIRFLAEKENEINEKKQELGEERIISEFFSEDISDYDTVKLRNVHDNLIKVCTDKNKIIRELDIKIIELKKNIEKKEEEDRLSAWLEGTCARPKTSKKKRNK